MPNSYLNNHVLERVTKLWKQSGLLLQHFSKKCFIFEIQVSFFSFTLQLLYHLSELVLIWFIWIQRRICLLHEILLFDFFYLCSFTCIFCKITYYAYQQCSYNFLFFLHDITFFSESTRGLKKSKEELNLQILWDHVSDHVSIPIRMI